MGRLILKTGETVEAGVVIAPDLEWAVRLEELLGQQGRPLEPAKQRLLRSDTGIEARFYVLHREGVPLANIFTFPCVVRCAAAGLS